MHNSDSCMCSQSTERGSMHYHHCNHHYHLILCISDFRSTDAHGPPVIYLYNFICFRVYVLHWAEHGSSIIFQAHAIMMTDTSAVHFPLLSSGKCRMHHYSNNHTKDSQIWRLSNFCAEHFFFTKWIRLHDFWKHVLHRCSIRCISNHSICIKRTKSPVLIHEMYTFYAKRVEKCVWDAHSY